MTDKFDRLINILQKELKLTGTEIAEILWLAMQRHSQSSSQTKTTLSGDGTITEENQTVKITKSSETSSFTKPQVTPPSVSEQTPAARVYLKTASTSSRIGYLPIKVPDTSSLRYPLNIARSLRPLIRYISSGKAVLLDEETTVERIAELEGICIPVLKPPLELQFDLALVVDESDSMIFWRRTTQELQQLFKHYGVFRNLRTWGMVTDEKGNIRLRQGIGKKTHSHYLYSPQKLIDPSGRRLILVVSDCVSDIWRNGKAFSVLETWGKHNILAIVQILPERMWLRSALSLGAMVQLDCFKPTVPNRNLFVKEILLWNDVDLKTGIKVPVFSLEPDLIETWSEMVVRKGSISAGGFVFSASSKQEQMQLVEDADRKNLTSEERVYNFQMSSSEIAQNLAKLLAAAPVINLPVVRLIQHKLLRQSQQVHVAEVFLGGILKPQTLITPDTNPDEVQYHFIDEKIRDILLKESPRTDSKEIITVISQDFANRLGKTLKEFYALLKKPDELEKLTQEKNAENFDVKHFAQITTKVLKRLGGAYARFAEEIEVAWKESNDERWEERNDEQAALLARQAYYFNQQDRLQILAQVDDALRQALSAPYFSNILKHDSVAFSSIAFSPDGTKLAASGWDGNIYLWNPEQSYSEFKLLAGHKAGINAIAFSPDGQWLVSGSRDKTVIVWDLSQNDPVFQVIGKHEQDVTSIAFKPDGSLLASGSKDRTVKLWNWPQLDRSPIVLAEHSSRGQMGMVRSLTFSPYGSQLAVGCDDRSIWLWDVQEPAQAPDKEPTVFYGHGKKIRSLAFSPGGRWLASASDDCTIRIWDITQPQTLPQILKDHTAPVRTVAFSPDGKMLASGSDDQTIRLWKTDKFGKTDRLDEAHQILRGHTFNITSVAFSPDDQYLVSCGWDNTVRRWDLNRPVATPKILSKHQKTVRAIAISPQYHQDHMLASGSEDGTVRVWNLNRLDAELKTFKRCGQVFGVALFVSDDRQVQLLAAGSDDNIVRLWDLQQPSDVPPRQFKGHQDGVSSVAFSPDGQWLASGSWDKTVRLWDLDQPDPEPIIFKGDKGHTNSVTSVKFSPDGKILASASDDKRVLLWNIDQPDADPTELKNHSGRVWSIAFSPDGQLLASASDDWTVRLWNLEKLDLENPNPENLVHVKLEGHSAWVSSVAFSPDGKTLASGSFDRTIRLWQIDQIDWKSRTIREDPIVLENHNQSVTSVAFTPDGKYLASGSFDNTVRLWIASTDILAEMVCQKVLRNLTMQEWQQFMGDDIPYERTCPNLPPGAGTS